MNPPSTDLESIKAQLAQLTAMLTAGIPTAPVAPSRSSFSVDEAAKLLNRSAYTVREWCREGQCNAYKLPGWKSGKHDRWRIAAEEIERIREEGLFPVDGRRNQGKTGRR